MKQKLISFSQSYGMALGRYLKQGPRANFRPTTLRLGREAVALGLETLALARIHEQEFVTLESGMRKSGRTRLAQRFFNEVLRPMMEIDRAARRSDVELGRLNEMLSERTRELTAANGRLQRGLVRRQRVAAAIKKHGVSDTRRLQESLQQQERLRELTHKNLSAQEKERKAMSHHLQDEIVQTLLGIQVRLLNLRTVAQGGKANLRKEIASAQRVVEESVKSIHRFARELGPHRPT